MDAITANNLTRLGDAVLSLSDNDNATALLSLATATDELPDADKLTLFAPENAAWPAPADLPTGEALLAVLLGHVVPAFLESPAVIEAVSGGEPVALDTLAMTKINATLVRSLLRAWLPIRVLYDLCVLERSFCTALRPYVPICVLCYFYLVCKRDVLGVPTLVCAWVGLMFTVRHLSSALPVSSIE